MRSLRSLALLAAAITCSAAPSAAAVTGACHVSPIVTDLDRTVRFYRDLLGLEMSPATAAGPIEWKTGQQLLNLHGLPTARLRTAVLRVPGAQCGIEPVQFERVDRKRVQLRMQDAGAVTLILLVRDIDSLFAKLRAARVPVVTTGGAPVAPSPTSKTRAVIVKDPDGQFVELAQLEPPPATKAPASANVFDIRFRVTVTDLDEAVKYYRERLGIAGKSATFTASAGVMAMMGLPATVEYRVNMTPIPGSTLILEFLELKGLDRSAPRVRVQDPGAYRLHLTVDDIDQTLGSLRAAGTPVISTGGTVVMAAENGSRLAAVRDPNNLFLVLQQGPLP